MANPTKAAKGRNRIKRGPGKRMVDGKSFRLADEVRYIQRRAAELDSRIVSIGQLVLFSSESGDAWMLDPAGHLAVRLARRYCRDDRRAMPGWAGIPKAAHRWPRRPDYRE